MSTEIRLLGSADAGLLKRTRLAALADSPAAFATTLAVAEARGDDFWQRQCSGFLGEQACATWIAVDAGGEGVGMLAGVDAGSSTEVIQVWVAPSHRGTGLIDELFRAVLAWSPHERIDIAVAESNARAKRVYERLGFRVTGDHPGVNELEVELRLSRTRKRIAVDGVSLVYEVFGSGRPVYVCHGGPSTDYQYLRDDLSTLADSLRLVFHDYRGSGASDVAAPETYTFDQLADDVDSLRRSLGDERIVVLGHSMGGDVAVRVAVRHPQSVAGLVLVGASPGTSMMATARAMSWTALARAFGRAAVYVARWSWRPETPERRLARYAIWKATFEARPKVQASLDDRAALRMHDNAAALERAGFDQTIWKQLGGLMTPILLIYGTRDAAAVAAARRFNATTASVAEFVVDGGGHHPLFEDKSTVEAVRAFVAEHLG